MSEQTQTTAERTEIFRNYFRDHFAKDFPDLEPIYNENGGVLCNLSHIVLAQIFPEQPKITFGVIRAKLAELSSQGLLVRKQKIVVVERQPSAAEKAEAAKKEKKANFEKAHAAGLLNSAKHNRTELDDQFDHGKAQPLPLTEQQRVALNEKNRRDDAIIADVTSRITNYTGATHSKTYAGRDALKQTFTDAMNRGLSAEQVQKEVEAKLNSMTSNNSVR